MAGLLICAIAWRRFARCGARFGLAASRPLPTWSSNRSAIGRPRERRPLRRAGRLSAGGYFNRYFEPENLRAAVNVLAAAGYGADRTETKGRPLCCGRTWLAAGLVDRARAEALRTMRRMPGDIPVVGLEPSCVMTLRDEFRSLLPGAETDRFASRAMMISEFLAKEKPDLALGRCPAARKCTDTATRRLSACSPIRWRC